MDLKHLRVIEKTGTKSVQIDLQDAIKAAKDQILLGCLMETGVDNWEGWDYAMVDYLKEIKNES